MTWYAVYRTATGELVSVGSSVAAELPAELTVVEYENRPDQDGARWNAATLSFEPGPPPPRLLSRLAFTSRLTPQERVAIRKSPDEVVQDFMHLLELAQEVDLDYPDTQQGLLYMESTGLLAPGRAAEILA